MKLTKAKQQFLWRPPTGSRWVVVPIFMTYLSLLPKIIFIIFNAKNQLITTKKAVCYLCVYILDRPSCQQELYAR